MAAARPSPNEILQTWYGLILKLVRHTPTYSPPVASRAFGYLGVTAYEAMASGTMELRSLSGQLNGLSGVPNANAARSTTTPSFCRRRFRRRPPPISAIPGRPASGPCRR